MAEAIPIPDARTSTCVKALIRHWIVRFGIPNDIISDRGAQFTSCLWIELVRSLGVTMHQTTAYHPQANGMIEKLHRQLKNSLKARTDDQYLMDHLPMVLLRIRTARREDPYSLPAELVYGSSLRIPGEFVEPTTSRDVQPSSAFLRGLQTSMNNALPPPVKYHSSLPTYMPNTLSSTRYVYVRVDGHRTPPQRPYTGPFRIISTSDKYFTLDINGRSDNVSIDRLKTAYVYVNHNTDESHNAHVPQPTTTRYGLTTRPPKHFTKEFVAAVT